MRDNTVNLTQPILWLMYFFNFLDRNAMINGRLNGLEEHLNLKGSQYNTCVSILFVGYLCGQIPSNMILNRVRPSWYMSGKFSKFPVHFKTILNSTYRLLLSMVYLVNPDICGQDFREHACLSLPARHHRGALLPRCSLHDLHVL